MSYVYAGPGYMADLAAGTVPSAANASSNNSTPSSSSDSYSNDSYSNEYSKVVSEPSRNSAPASVQTTVTGTGNLSNGMKSSDVMSLQKRLNELGYGLAVDGSFGPATMAAVKDYQTNNGLAVDGIVGANTRAALNASSAATPSAASVAAPVAAAPAAATIPLERESKKSRRESTYSDEINPYSNEISTYSNAINNYSNEIENLIDELKGVYEGKKNDYDEALEAQKVATAAAVEKAQNDLTAQKDTVAQSYADANRQLYLDKMKSQKNIAQQMAAMGQTGGQAESTLLGLNTSYTDALRQNSQAQENALTELDKAIIDAQLSGSASDASATAENAINKANSYTATLQNLIGTYGNLAQAERAQANADREYKYSLAQAERAQENADREYNYNLAVQLLGNGQMPSDDVLYSAGISKDNAAAIIAQNAAPTVIKSSGSGSRSDGSNEGNTIDALWTSFKYGDRSPSTIKAIEDYYGAPIATIAAKYGIEYRDTAEEPTSTESKSTGMTAPYSNEYMERKNNVPAIEVTADIYQKTQGNTAAREYVKKAYNGADQLLNYEDYARLMKKYS